MKRLIVLIAALGLVLAACGGSSSTAATVNGTEITAGDIDGLFYEVDEDFTEAQNAQYLGTLIQWTAIEQRAAADLAFQPTQEETDAEIETILFDSGYVGDLDGFLAAQNVSEEGMTKVANQFLIEDAVIVAVTPTIETPTLEDAQATIDENPLQFTQVCASHILVETEGEAVAVTERVDAGEDFAAVATEVSIDTGTGPGGGSLGCNAAASYVPEFAAAAAEAPIGEVTEPVETEFGYHVIVVESRTIATPEEVQLLMEDQAVSAATNEWLLEAITTADVTVEAEYGTWETEPSPQVVPPPA
ncbi:MAG: peptidylprolyl isomerase [Acidimicrobiia bacterium]